MQRLRYRHLSVALAASLWAASPTSAENLYIEAGRLIDGVSSEVRTGQCITVEAERIKAVAPCGPMPDGAKRLDWSAFTVLPGLIDIQLEPCDRIEIELPHAGGITAVVIWASGRLFGCQFEGPVSPATLSAVELKSAVAPPPEVQESGAEPALDESPDDAAPEPLQEVIDRSREQIARAAGLGIDRVRIIVEY